ncbi:MAG: glycosyltransferase [Deltaproteobacteria bacterium]|nr:glycosyltransferase [Deltaproteobacteria bacterium]
MKILTVHNEYGKFSGEEAVVQSLSRLFAEHGHEVRYFSRSSAEIPGMRLGNIRAFFSGIYSFSSKKAMSRCLQEFKPDIVHVHNVFPLISPSVLGVCRRAGVPVVMAVHNYRLVCPNGLHMTHGRVCEKCCGGREYWCVLRNCEGNPLKSIGYALRNYVARKLRLFKKNVTMYTCLTKFQKERLIKEGFNPARCSVIPNMSTCDIADPYYSPGQRYCRSIDSGQKIIRYTLQSCWFV